ncbi:hypothetical protein R5R35_006926 [Gryllus longicercus]|uniref:Tc1-like transposase DDE domain-containing protein n=1 Tax=Gryllus longicercus TaxID=2509291 RepID=A0AAN9VS95_9ORTH
MSEQKVPRCVEQRIIIKFLVGENVQPSEILQRLKKQYREECLSRTRVFEWCKCFREGRERVENEPHNRRPRTSITPTGWVGLDGDWMGVIHVDFLTEANTINGAYYSALLETEIKEKIRSKRKRGGKRVAFLHDNARPHTAKTTMATISKLKWDLLPHPPYSPDLAPSDFYLFGQLKSHLQGMRFADNDAVIHSVREWICRQPKDFYEKDIRMLPGRWKKCIESGGKYFED